MIDNLFIILIFFTQFIDLIFIERRMEIAENIIKKSLENKEYNLSEIGFLIIFKLREIYGLILLFYLIYSIIFSTQLRIYSITTILILILDILLEWILKRKGIWTVEISIFIAKIFFILIMLIWLYPFINLIKMIF